jgi:small-conductance mechanosensitive channel
MRQKYIIWYFIAGILVFLGGSYFFAGKNNLITGTLATSSSSQHQNLDQKVKTLKDTQTEIALTKEKIVASNKILDQAKLTLDTLNLEAKSQKNSLNKENTKLAENTKQIEIFSQQISEAKQVDKIAIQEKKQQLEKTNQDLVAQIKKSETAISSIQVELSQKEKEKEQAQYLVNELQTNLNTKNQSLNLEFNSLIGATIALFQNYAVYFVVLLLYWLLYKSVLFFVVQKVQNYSVRTGLRVTFRIIWLLLSTVTIVYALASQFSYILTSLGFVSAALVFALQNFVASFFVFILLTFTKNIKSGDIVKVGPTNEAFFGQIVSVGYLYTLMREIDPETFEEAGRTISVPNNFFLTHPISNFTFVNRVVWQSLEIVTTKDSDYTKSKIILEALTVKKYNWMVRNRKDYLDNEIDLEAYQPKVFMSLGERGYAFTIHLPCRFNKYNEVSDQLLLEIITEFDKNDIHIAFAP